MENNIKKIVYTKLSKNILDEWQLLWENSSQANYVNSPYWLLSVLENFNYNKYVIITIYRNGQLKAVVALIKEKKLGINFYTVPPLDSVYETPILCDPEDKLAEMEIIKEIAKIGNILFSNIPPEFIAQQKQYITNLTAVPNALNYYINFERDGNGQVLINNKDKYLRKVKGMSEKIKLISYSGFNEEVLKLIYQIDNLSMKQTRGYGTFTNESFNKFYISLANRFNKHFLTYILYFEDKPIAYRLGFIINNTYYGTQTAYLREYSQYEPGKVLLVKVIEHLAENNINKYDFGSGDNLIKRTVSNGSRHLNTVIISNNIMIRNYAYIMYYAREKLFNKINKHKNIYVFYKKVKLITKYLYFPGQRLAIEKK